MHAWAERNDQLWGHGRRQQSTVVGQDPVPDKTEFSPSVREFNSRGAQRAFSDEVPRPYQVELSGGSLSHVPGSTEDFLKRGAAVVVGGRRLSDGEMAPYSGAGTSRSSTTDRGRLPGGDNGPVERDSPTPLGQKYPGTVRSGGPDVDAPSDAGLSLKGVRTIGLREGSVARLGGTSAAAPLVTRYIADGLYQRDVLGEKFVPRELSVQCEDPASKGPDQRSRRATRTPTRDDRAHRGKTSLGPRRK